MLHKIVLIFIKQFQVYILQIKCKYYTITQTETNLKVIWMLKNLSYNTPHFRGRSNLTAQFHGGIQYFSGTGTGKLVPENLSRENPSMRVISNTEGYLRGCSTRGAKYHSLVYASAQKNSAMKLRELQTRGRGRVYWSLYPGNYSAMEAICHINTRSSSIKYLDSGLRL